MHKLNKTRTKPPEGDRLWRNPTDRTLRIKIYGAAKQPPKVHVLEPDDTIAFPAYWGAGYVKLICRFLVPDDAPAEKKHSKPVDKPKPVPPEADKPLGDPSKVQSEEKRIEGEKASHSSGDALEAFAQQLMRKSKAELVKDAAALEIDVEGVSKIEVARAIALKSVEDDESD